LLPLEQGPAILVAWIGCSPKQVELAKLVLQEEVSRLTREPVSTSELLTARETWRQSWLQDLQSTQKLTARQAQEVQRELQEHKGSEIINPLFLQEIARSSFDGALIESFPGPLLAAHSPEGR
jgi:hypothetical protein